MIVKAFIFDVDGVLVDSPHERAWGDTLRDLLENRWPELIGPTGYSPELYTSEVYQRVVAGKPRAEGAAALLTYFRIDDPDGSRCRRLCDQKQDMIVRLIDEGEFRAYDDALRFLVGAKAGGAHVAAASSSKNAGKLMSGVDLSAFCRRAGLECGFITPGTALVDIFDADVCGREFRQGKPHPEIFLTAAQMLGVEPAECVVIEDAPSGVQAAKAGGMACIGIARCDDEDLLRSANADWVVTSLDQLDPAQLVACGCTKGIAYPGAE